jgi:group I intron endonuclease
METIAFVYKWTHIPTLKWYIGSRTRKGCNPDDGYICSSRIVKPLIEANPKEWVREIIETGTSEDMYLLEMEILKLFNAMKDPRSFNNCNGYNTYPLRFKGYNHTEETKKKLSAAHKGKIISEEHRQNISKSRLGEKHRLFGKKHPKEVIEKMSEAKKGEKNPSFGKSPSKETRKKQSEKLKGIPRPKVICPYCLKEGPVGIHHKYHFENCKSK